MRGNYAVGVPHEGRAAEPEAEDDAIDLRDIWRLVVKHKWLLVSIATVGLLAALLLSFLRTPLYLASTTVQVDKRAARVVQFGQEADASADLDDRTGMGTQLELLQSRVLAERVIDELRLDRQGLPQDLPAATAPGAEEEADPPEGEPANTGWMAVAGNMLGKIQQSWDKVRQPATDSAERLNREQVIAAFDKTVTMELVRNSRMIKV